jgi:hypothetical protein
MDDQLRSKLLANDEISLELEQQENEIFSHGFRTFYKDPDHYERLVSCFIDVFELKF